MLGRADAADGLSILMNQAKLVKLPGNAGTIVVGNPLVADLSVQAGGIVHNRSGTLFARAPVSDTSTSIASLSPRSRSRAKSCRKCRLFMSW